MDLDKNTAWDSRSSRVTNQFSKECRALCDENPFSLSNPLARVLDDLMTELWDMGFSQTDISQAFSEAVERIPHYAAGEDCGK
jgi:hypothetical protein